ncbi:MAG: substrate-binding domain-containing protein [Armatimonadetes bacterium]|nr:substrate-binding domain-containing protein [Armatimonadota bacterium]
MNHFKFVIFSTLAIAALGLVGCSGGPKDEGQTASTTGASTGSGDGGAKKYRIAFIPKGATHEFWKSMQAGAEKAAAENNVELLWKAPLKEDDRAEQIKVVENFTAEKVDGIILAPLDEEALKAPVQEAQSANIPIVIVDSALKDTKVVSFIATDNKLGGKLGGEKLAQVVGAGGKVILLRYAEGSASTMAREDGFMEAAKEGKLEIASQEQHAGATRETAQSAAENLISRFKTADGIGVTGIFTPNESSTFGFLRALQNAQLAGKVHFVGFDSSKELLQAVRDGQIDGLVLQNPYKMGYEGITNMVKHLKGETVPETIDTGAVLVDKTNIDNEEIKNLLPKN